MARAVGTGRVQAAPSLVDRDARAHHMAQLDGRIGALLGVFRENKERRLGQFLGKHR